MQQEQLGKYQLLERLGRGGMGEVWKARDTELRRYVAIKLLNADLQADPDFVAHFMREAQLVASLRHPNIVQIHDFQHVSTQGGGVKAYMVMDYIEGGTLADFIRETARKGRFSSPVDIVYLFTAISLALDYAHGTGMVHRDIKPANILLDRSIPGSRTMGEPVLTDFGIARLQGPGAATATHSFVGTPLYVSPEQAGNRPVDVRSDLYSLGIVLYEVMTGITPYRGDSPLVIMMRHVQEQPPSPALINPNISPALSAVILRSIAKEPRERFPSATAMTVELARAFNIPVPEHLREPEERSGRPAYNPLQPLSGATPVAPSFVVTPLPTSSIPAPEYSAPRAVTPAYLPPALSAQGGSVGRTPMTNSSISQGEHLPQPLPSPKLPSRPFSRRTWLFACLAGVALLLIGISVVVVPSLLASRGGTPTLGGTSAVVGSIRFMSSSNASQGPFDQLRIQLSNLPSLPGDKTYYAWLTQSNSEAIIIPHWQLQPTNGTVDRVFSYSQYSDLFTSSNRFLVTVEDTNAPDIPNLDLSRRLYYAVISHASPASPPTFQVERCPSNTTSNAANPCH